MHVNGGDNAGSGYRGIYFMHSKSFLVKVIIHH